MGDEVWVIAKYDYRAQDMEELDLRKNEKLVLLDDNRDWWKVRNAHGHDGYVPSNYVAKRKPSILSSIKNIGKGSLGRKTKSAGPDGRPAVGSPLMPGGPMSPPASLGASGGASGSGLNSIGEVKGVAALAKYPYVAQKKDEMGFEKGEKVRVVEKSLDGWWRGVKVSGESGWFPSNYMEEEDQAEDSDRADTAMSDTPSGAFISMNSGSFSSPAGPSLASVGPARVADSGLERVVALYDFEGSSSEELPFRKGDFIVVLEHPPDDPQWMRGRLETPAPGGKTIGLVPKNYVKEMETHKDGHATNGSVSGGGGSGWDGNVDSFSREEYVTGRKYEGEKWFYGVVTRSCTEALFVSYGTIGSYLVRESESSPGSYTVSVKASPERSRHFRVNLQEGRFHIGQQTFGSVAILLDHYTRHPIYKGESEKLYLSTPLVIER